MPGAEQGDAERAITARFRRAQRDQPALPLQGLLETRRFDRDHAKDLQRLDEIRPQGQCLPEGGLRLAKPSQAMQGGAGMEPCLGHGGIGRDRLAAACQCLGEFARGVELPPEARMRGGEIRLERDGGAIAGDCLGTAAGIAMRVAEIEMGVGKGRKRPHRPADELDRVLRPPPGDRDHSQHMQRVRVVRRLVEDAAIERRGPIQPPRAMMIERGRKLGREARPAFPGLHAWSALPVGGLSNARKSGVRWRS